MVAAFDSTAAFLSAAVGPAKPCVASSYLRTSTSVLGLPSSSEFNVLDEDETTPHAGAWPRVVDSVLFVLRDDDS